jgi:hypothetical protein
MSDAYLSEDPMDQVHARWIADKQAAQLGMADLISLGKLIFEDTAACEYVANRLGRKPLDITTAYWQAIEKINLWAFTIPE